MLVVCSSLTCLHEAPAQTPLLGAWNQSFDHEDGITSAISATDPRTAFPNVTWDPSTGAFPVRMNAAHAALIPKGPHQGKILVWDVDPILGSPPPGQTSPTNLFSYQAYSIVDPRPTIPVGHVRFRNFLLPIRPVVLDAGGNRVVTGLFCSGHAWSQFGDLVVVGGTAFTQTAGGTFQAAANMTWVFSPTQSSLDYTGQVGRWFEGPALQSSRYYPTATLTGPIARLAGNNAILVLGGEAVVDNLPDPTWNSYEALEVRSTAGSDLFNLSGLVKDTYTNNLNQTGEWSGPMAAGSNPFVDSLSFYPRCHLLTDGRVFMSGFAPLSSKLNHETTLWSAGPGQGTVPGGWNQFRLYGSSVRFPNLGPFPDWMVRVGGTVVTTGTTPTVEAINAADPNAQWAQTYSMNLPRATLNCVVLADASILAIGGVNNSGSAHFQPEIYSPGTTGWTLLQPGFATRAYHSTALTLPDGRVFVGGGDDHEDDRTGGTAGRDYEVFTPPYFTPPNNAMPVVPTIYGITTTYDFTGQHFDLARSTKYSVVISQLPLGTSIDSVVLLAPGSVTHHSDMSQRYHQVPFKHKTPTIVEFDTPAPGSVLPTGIYMLQLVTNAGAPTDAAWVRLLP